MKLEGIDYNFNNPEEQRTNVTAGYHPKNISILTALNDDMFRRLAPTVVVLVAVMVVGVAGNILICYIFTRKLRRNSQNFLLLCLGIFDLLSSCVGVPSEIFDVRHYYLYESVEMCKAMRFLTTFPSLASILVLLVIAVDRYRKICKPLHHQIHLSHARIALIIIVVIAFTLSVPALYIYGHRSFPTPVPGVYGYDCSVDDAFKDQPYPLVYEGIFLAAFSVCTIVLASIYIRIWLETKRHIKYLETHATFGTGLLDEATTTTSSLNFEDSSLENILEDISQTRSKKASHKSLQKKRSSSHSHRKVSSSPTFLRDSDSTSRFQGPAVIKLTKKPSEQRIKNDLATSETCNCRWQIGSGTDDCDLDNGASEALYELQTYKTGNEVSIKFFNSQVLPGEEINESVNPTKELESSIKQLPKTPVQKDFDNHVQSKVSTHSVYSEGGRGIPSNKSVIFNQEISVSNDFSQQRSRMSSPDFSKTVNVKERIKYDASDNILPRASSENIKDSSQPKCGKKQVNSTSSSGQTGIMLQGKRDFVRYSKVPTRPSENNQDDLLPGNTSQNGVQLRQNSSVILSEFGFESSANAIATQSADVYRAPPTRTLHHSKSSQSLLIAKRVRKALRATRTTIIAFTITIGFILSYLPHLILIILRSVKTDFEHHFDDVSLIFYNIFIRSYFANNVINIFVYGTMNLEFRTQILNVWSKIKCSKKLK
ncbi:unnamed protein product [Candidula unifasciata]|uniref:G-protein coupled receptors family 1 profile domain-containing protein n=1 Tax=Candidula unifasciata TaxID=100452 RepID=A0A8S4AB03_9EUPU|nr:unnamed protein product [Candidula unifasciata]